MTTVHIETGLPGSGKSTHAKSLGVLMYSLDDYRSMMRITQDVWTRDLEDLAVSCMIESIRVAIEAGKDVAIDNTHLVPRLPRMYRREFSKYGVTFKVHDHTDVSIEEAIKRDFERMFGTVGESVIRRLAENHAGATKGGWKLTDEWMNSVPHIVPERYEPRPGAINAVIIDIDGTVALHGNERGHYEYEKVSTDQPNWPIIRLARALYNQANVILFVSGREDRCKNDTWTWLQRYGLDFNGSARLFMRETKDHRPDYVIKAEIFDKHIRRQYHVRLVLDDRDQVVKYCWRAMGLTCLQVADGKF